MHSAPQRSRIVKLGNCSMAKQSIQSIQLLPPPIQVKPEKRNFVSLNVCRDLFAYDGSLIFQELHGLLYSCYRTHIDVCVTKISGKIDLHYADSGRSRRRNLGSMTRNDGTNDAGKLERTVRQKNV